MAALGLGGGAQCQPGRPTSSACNLTPGCVSTNGPTGPPAPLLAPLPHGEPGTGYPPPRFPVTPQAWGWHPSEGPPAPNTAFSPDAIRVLGWGPIPHSEY